MVPKIFVVLFVLLLSACQDGGKPKSEEVIKEPTFNISPEVTLGVKPEDVSLKGISRGLTAQEMIRLLPTRSEKERVNVKLMVFSVGSLGITEQMVSSKDIYEKAKSQGYGACPQDVVLYMLLGKFDKPNTILYVGMEPMLDNQIFEFSNAGNMEGLAINGTKDLSYAKSDYFLLCQTSASP